MSERITVAVVGLGYWGPNLARNFASSPDFQLVALCDRMPDRLERVSRLYPGATASGDLDEILDGTRPELVAVATPVGSHREISARAIHSGAHVLVEKPLAASVEEAEEILAIAAEANRRVFVDQTFLFTGAVQAIQREIGSGSLGDLLYVDSVRINLGLVQPDVDVIWDLAPHDLSILDHVLARPPRSVIAVGSCHNPNELVDVAYLHVDYGSGFTAHLHLSWLSPVKIRRMIFAGTKQSLIFDDLDQEAKVKLYDQGIAFDDVGDIEAQRRILVSYRRGGMVAPAIAPTEALAVQVAHIAEVLRGRAEPLSDGAAGLRIVKMLDAASRSLRNGGTSELIGP